MRRVAMLVGMAGVPLAAGGAGAAGAQIGCDDPAMTVSAAPASLEGFAVLFQENGVTFYGRAATREGTPVARILIRNGNRFPIEVSYSVLLEYSADSLPRSLALGRHCAQIPAGQYAVAQDAAPAPPSALRVRNLTISNLAAGQGSTGPAVTTPGAAPRSVPVAGGAGTPPAAAPVNRRASLGPVRPEDATVGAWAVQAAFAVFFLLSAIVMVAAGLGLAIPVLGGFALLLSLVVTALRRRIAGRAA